MSGDRPRACGWARKQVYRTQGGATGWIHAVQVMPSFWLLYRTWFIAFRLYHNLQEASPLTFNLLHRQRGMEEIVCVHTFMCRPNSPHTQILLTCAATAQPVDWPIGGMSKYVLEKPEPWSSRLSTWMETPPLQTIWTLLRKIATPGITDGCDVSECFLLGCSLCCLFWSSCFELMAFKITSTTYFILPLWLPVSAKTILTLHVLLSRVLSMS